MTNLSVFDFNAYPVRVILLDGEPCFESRDVCEVLDHYDSLRNASHGKERISTVFRGIEFLPNYISFFEVLNLIAYYPCFEFGCFIRDIVINSVSREQWKHRFGLAWVTFIESYFHGRDVFESEVYQQSLFRELVLNQKINRLKGFDIVAPSCSLPDFVFVKDGRRIVAEMKIVPFTGVMTKQVLKYIEKERANEGLVIAPELRCKLPHNVDFIKWEKISFEPKKC